MLINDEIQRQLLQLFAKSSNVSKFEAEQQSSSQLQLIPGQQVQAEVIAKLPNHLFLARIAGELFKMELPLNVQPGETMHMTFVSAEPRITFQMFKPDASQVPVNISTTGKWLSLLLNNKVASGDNLLQRTASTSPIINGPPVDAGNFAARLREALTLTGIFYESHLAEWVTGERQMKEIMREPQAKLGKRLAGQPQNSVPRVLEENFLASKMLDADNAPVSSKSTSSFIADPQTLPIIREQLATLNSGILVWNGQVWPEQQIEISIQEREPDETQVQDKEWETNLKLHLPQLGSISATLRLSGVGLTIVVQAEEPVAAATLNGGLMSLKESMDGAGITLAEMVVRNDEKAG